MSIDYTKYETVIGLEIHVQLNTLSKAYCSDSTKYGSAPNTHVSPISLGHPGTLPVSNAKVLESAVKLGIALKCDIRERNEYARKNYFYADLPKGYQITQDKTPICDGGFIYVTDKEGNPKRIDLTRIHMEEDAGKSIHDIDPFDSLIDLNRAGVALLEIVTEPVLRSGEEAYSFVTEIRKLVRYLDVCDGNMDEGSMRCDANISVRLKGETDLRNRVEVKNMNSIRNVQKAIELEEKRQIEVYENNGEVDQETRNFNAAKNETSVLRSKEDAHDYRYFPEPDLLPVVISDREMQDIKDSFPELPNEKEIRFESEFGLSAYDSKILASSKSMADFFEASAKELKNYPLLANWLIGEISAFLNKDVIEINESKLTPENLAMLINRIDDQTISGKIAKSIFEEMCSSGKTPDEIIDSQGLQQISDDGEIEKIINAVIEDNPTQVEGYKNGKDKLFGFFVGQVMKETQGKANPQVVNELLKKKLT